MTNRAVRIVKRGDTVFLPDGFGKGEWTNGVVNAVAYDDATGTSTLLIGTRGHKNGQFVAAPLASYGTWWCWPEDIVNKREEAIQ